MTIVPTYSVEDHVPADEWNALSEDDRIEHVRAAHEATRSVSGQDPTAHATIHVLVENRLAENHPGATRAFERFRAAGLSRHSTIHALASVVTRHMLTMLETGATPDETTVNADFDALDPAALRKR